jgi:hypothetical protein
MKVLALAVAAVIIQSIALAAFGVAGKAGWEVGKPLIIALTVLAMAYLTGHGVRRLKALQAVIGLPLAFAAAFLVAFHVTGALAFPGLLKDASLSADYLGALLRVSGVVFVGYMAMSVLLYLLSNWLDGRRLTLR